jgi:sugar/nucleoside kinase (ribokinase family)
MKKLDVLALGTCNIDFLMNVTRFASADDEVDIENLNISMGGSAANFAMKTSRLGLNTGIMARIGKDHYGQYIRTQFNKENIDTEQLISIDERTGMAFISVDPQGERSIYTFMGANSNFKLNKKDIQLIKRSEILHITGMYTEVVEEASKHANKLSINPGSLMSSYGMEKLENILKNTEILFLNKKEVTLLTGKNFEDGANLLVDTGIPMVVVTMGRDGSKVYTANEEIEYHSKDVKVLDTTGAGDSFAAGFINAFHKKKDIIECLKYGDESAKQCITKIGSIESQQFI